MAISPPPPPSGITAADRMVGLRSSEALIRILLLDQAWTLQLADPEPLAADERVELAGVATELARRLRQLSASSLLADLSAAVDRNRFVVSQALSRREVAGGLISGGPKSTVFAVHKAADGVRGAAVAEADRIMAERDRLMEGGTPPGDLAPPVVCWVLLLTAAATALGLVATHQVSASGAEIVGGFMAAYALSGCGQLSKAGHPPIASSRGLPPIPDLPESEGELGRGESPENG